MTNGLGNVLDAPTSGAKIQIGASYYEPRWSFLAEYILATRDLTLAKVLEGLNGPTHNVELGMQLIAACISHHYPSNAFPLPGDLAKEMTGAPQYFAAIRGCLDAGRAAGAIVDKPKNSPAPVQPEQQTAPSV